VREFLSLAAEDVHTLLMTRGTAPTMSVQYRQQIDAWRIEIEVLREVCAKLVAARRDTERWSLLLEFEIPRRQKRPDVVLLADSVIFVIEFKVGSTSFDRAAMWQVEEYALDLHEFHAGSHDYAIVPILVATNATASERVECTRAPRVMPVHRLRPADLVSTILSAESACHLGDRDVLDRATWECSPYRPVLSVIEAAERLYAQHGVREISHAYADNLGGTCEAVVEAVRDAQTTGSKVVCFVTGVPGSGKTLAGLSAVHDPELRKDARSCGIFLSGNVPLVRILREALARDRVRKGITRETARREVTTFVQNVHVFIEEYGIKNPNMRPHEHVIVFDEAQRAWDAEQVKKKRDIEKSEAALILEIMSRCEGWSVVVALVGEGQEIYKGEAGLPEWRRAIESRGGEWQIVASPHAIETGGAPWVVAEGGPLNITLRPSLHLEVNVRSPRAKRIHEWVDYVLTLRRTTAREILGGVTDFPMVLTRDLDAARRWLRDRSRGDRRSGLVSSSRNLRHRAYGLELSSSFRQGCRFEDWFLNGPSDVRSSYQLEVAASQFECQGLELDWVGLCWGSDFCIDPETGKWLIRHFVGSSWQKVTRADAKQNLVNTYRVLLTRARQGLVIWVPPGSSSDITLDPALLDSTADYLVNAGVQPLAEE
jgi:hypothetical protein